MTTGNRYASLFDRLCAHIRIEADCWTWIGPVRKHGGGHRPSVTMRTPGAGRAGHPKQFNAARLMCGIIHGPPPTPLHEASHLCQDNWLCICPDHVLWETKRENMARRWKTVEDDPDIEVRGELVTECPF